MFESLTAAQKVLLFLINRAILIVLLLSGFHLACLVVVFWGFCGLIQLGAFFGLWTPLEGSWREPVIYTLKSVLVFVLALLASVAFGVNPDRA